jgi:type I restriction enzyme, S subunit
MAVFNIVKLSKLEGAKRLDADYYQPEFELIKESLKKIGEPLGNLISYIKHPTEIKRIYETKGIPYILAENIHSNFWILQFTEKRYISEEIATQIPENRLEVGDVLLTRTGANFGDACVYLGEPYPAYASAHIIIIRPSKISGEYLAAFFNTRYGKKLIKRGWYGSSQPEISPTYLVTLPIPQLGIENEITSIVRNAYDLYRRSQFLYSQAETLLLEELGLKDFKPKYKKTYTANLSYAFSARRIDAEYFQLAYEEVIEKIKNYKNGFVSLLKHVEDVKPNFDPTKYPDKIFSYVELADIDSSIGVIHSVNEIKGEKAPSRARRMLKEGDVIVSSVEGSLEKVALVDKEHDGCLASTGFFQFRPLDILPEVLLVLSKTIVLQSQLKKRCSGTILTAVPKESLRDIIIPILPLSIQQKIASLVQQSHEARRKAKKLLEVAKRAVEIAIEKNEKEALDYISKALPFQSSEI